MSEEKYIQKLREVKKNIEGMLNFEKRALANFGEHPKDEQKYASWRDFTEPIARTISAYETSIGFLEKAFPELKEHN